MIIRIDGRPRLIHLKQVAGDKTPTLTVVPNWFNEFKKMPSRDSDIDLLVAMTRMSSRTKSAYRPGVQTSADNVCFFT